MYLSAPAEISKQHVDELLSYIGYYLDFMTGYIYLATIECVVCVCVVNPQCLIKNV